MANGTPKKKKKATRGDRVASVELPPGFWRNLWARLHRGPVLVRLALCALTAVILWTITGGWAPPQPYRKGDVPARNITARIRFEQVDEQGTREARQLARRQAVPIFDQDPAPITDLRDRLVNDVSKLRSAENYDDIADLWNSFQLERSERTPEPTADELRQQFEDFRAALESEDAFAAFKQALADALKPIVQTGILDPTRSPEHDANSQRIAVSPLEPIETVGFERRVPTSAVRLNDVRDNLRKSLEQKMNLVVALRAFAYLQSQLPVTLTLNLDATRAAQDRAEQEVQQKTFAYEPGATLAQAGEPLDEATLALLELEHGQQLAQRSFSENCSRSLAVFGMYLALYILCGVYIENRAPQILAELPRLVTMLALVVLVVSAMLLSPDEWRAEITPLMIFGMTVAVAYQQEVALLLSAAVTLVAVIAMGFGLNGALILMAATAGGILVLRQVRSRSKLLTVGFVAAIVAFFTTVGVGTLAGDPLMRSVQNGLLLALWSVIAGSLMTCLLPIVERVFAVQTDLSLIELGDPAHPLLQELIRRAPGTYNHSITVASLSESAAEAIGARGLLVRVGAYFHDIGKMLKPGYFVENQGQEDNRHSSLVPAMSTLVIIAHVKDGADLARQNRLPQPIIDFIQQHHGTTLVEYFFRQASQQQGQEKSVDESTFRYPGPKPQTKEAGVLMLADAVESASRVLVEPTPARIENLVDEICRKRLLDGQFDECGLTLEEVRTIGDSLVKSLTAVYHGRVKYPDQETA